MTTQFFLPFREPAPVVKWAGGKTRLLPQLLPLLPPDSATRRHIEPFAGGAAMFFLCRPIAALLSDTNANLIAMYEAVRDDVESIIERLQKLAAKHTTENYYRQRERYNFKRVSPAERAALFIYLNKTCFNGLHRVNRSGEFNVPAGSYKNPPILDADLLRTAAHRLASAELRCAGFETVLEYTRPGDFVYFDPPYVPTSDTANFTSYAADGFTLEDHSRLRDVFVELDRRGCQLMLSNSDADSVRRLYDGYSIETVLAPRSISCGKRVAVREVVVRNYSDSAQHSQVS